MQRGFAKWFTLPSGSARSEGFNPDPPHGGTTNPPYGGTTVSPRGGTTNAAASSKGRGGLRKRKSEQTNPPRNRWYSRYLLLLQYVMAVVVQGLARDRTHREPRATMGCPRRPSAGAGEETGTVPRRIPMYIGTGVQSPFPGGTNPARDVTPAGSGDCV